MSIYYKFKGFISFETKEVAEKQFLKLSGDQNGIFWRPTKLPSVGIFLNENKIRIDSEGFCSGESYYNTQDLIKDSVLVANSARVKCYEGNDEDDGTYDYIIV
jgi:hypothetical protein